MKPEISDESRQAATRCAKGFACLTGDRKDLCAVETCIGEKVHFVKCLQVGNCAYQHPFGSGHFCTCPVRKELFNKYKI